MIHTNEIVMKKCPPTHPWAPRSLLYGLHITLCLNANHFAAVIKKINYKKGDAVFCDKARAQVVFFHNDDGNRPPVAIVCVDEKYYSDSCLNTIHSSLVHEAVHVKQKTMKFIGETAPGDEIEAYVLQNITLELFELYDKLKIKIDSSKV